MLFVLQYVTGIFSSWYFSLQAEIIMKKKQNLFNALEGVSKKSAHLDCYDILMVIVIVISLLPLMFKEKYQWLNILDVAATAIFTADYLLRWYTADLKLKKGRKSFILYPVTPMAIIDLLAILPVITWFIPGLTYLHFIRFFKVFRTFKLLRYSQSCLMIRNTIYKQRHALFSAYMFAVFYIFISALLVFNVEPQTFKTFYDALYWAVVSLTTVGYGDIYPVSAVGRLVTVISAFVGIAIVALPSGIITAGYMAELEKSSKTDPEEK